MCDAPSPPSLFPPLLGTGVRTPIREKGWGFGRQIVTFVQLRGR